MTEPHEEAAGPWYMSPRYRDAIDVQAGFKVGRWFGRVDDRLWVGAAPRNEADYKTLRTATAVTHILNVADDIEAGTIRRSPYHVAYLRLPFPDDGRVPPDEWFRRGVEFTLDALVMSDTHVYIHCLIGSARGPAMAYAVLRSTGHTRTAAERAVRRARPMGSHYYLADAEAWVRRQP